MRTCRCCCQCLFDLCVCYDNRQGICLVFRAWQAIVGQLPDSVTMATASPFKNGCLGWFVYLDVSWVPLIILAEILISYWNSSTALLPSHPPRSSPGVLPTLIALEDKSEQKAKVEPVVNVSVVNPKDQVRISGERPRSPAQPSLSPHSRRQTQNTQSNLKATSITLMIAAWEFGSNIATRFPHVNSVLVSPFGALVGLGVFLGSKWY